MHHEIALFATIAMALLTAFIGGYIARKIGLPTLVGYLVAGMVIGPFTPGFVGDTEAASQLAELGVIFMMFGVGLHFSLKDLWNVRTIAVPGALLQMAIATVLGFGLTQLWGWSVSAGLVVGLALSIASTVVLLRGLEDNGLLNTVHGKVVVGWLVLEDLATIAILVMLPALADGSGNHGSDSIVIELLKTGVFVVIMLLAGARLMPWLLTLIARTRSRELFILAVVAVALGTAFAAAELFGVSLALGAFLAGMVVSESDISHQVGAEVLPFRDLFSVIFFVSVGMLVNPAVIWANLGQVIILTALIVVGKGIFTLLLGTILPASGRTILVVAAGLSQIGEFSFIVGQSGVALGILSQDQYGLILAGAVISIVCNPFMFRLIPVAERTLQKLPTVWKWLDRGGPTPEPLRARMRDHVVVVGYGRVGKHIGHVLDKLQLSYLVVENDAVEAKDIQALGIKTLFGDAANSEVLTHAGLDNARALVVTVPNQATAELVVASTKQLAPRLPIIARAGTESGVSRLASLGANSIIHPELEGGLEIVRHMLMALGYPMGQIQQYTDAVRSDAYADRLASPEQHRVLDQLLSVIRSVEIAWHPVSALSPVLGKTLAEANLRAKFGASVIAMIRNDNVLPNPKSDMRFQEGDLVAFIGASHELSEVELYLRT
ncbi:MAG: sodium:proton exchanger [Anaerolineaceae bacterium]|nr:sodium:proton exchanger [Anaerolineaceae bacterium]